MSAEVRNRRALVQLGLLILLVVAFLFVFVFPTRSLLAQRRDAEDARQQRDTLREESERLEQEAERLMSDAEVERIAREQYNLVRPGETPYAVVPVDPASTTTTTTPPPSPPAP